MTKPATRLLSALALASASLTLLACAGLSSDREVATAPPEPLYVEEAPAPIAPPPAQAAMPPRAQPAATRAAPPRAQAVTPEPPPAVPVAAAPVNNSPGQVQVNISGVLRMFVDGKLMEMEGSEGWVRGGLKPGSHVVEVRNVTGKVVATKTVTVEGGKCTHVRYDEKSLIATGTGPLVDTGV